MDNTIYQVIWRRAGDTGESRIYCAYDQQSDAIACAIELRELGHEAGIRRALPVD